MLSMTRAQVTKEQRDQAKKITYAVLYGLGSFGLAQQLNTTPGRWGSCKLCSIGSLAWHSLLQHLGSQEYKR